VSNLVILLGESFSRRSRSSGEWVILTSPPVWYEPEPVVPDLAGWRTDRFQASGEAAILPVPDWVCEVLSPLTALKDRGDKVRDYMAHRVRHGWWIDPVARTFEVFRLEENGRWSILNVFEGDAKVRTEPFDAIELDLSLVWAP
jgi:Uma2 family endonuclease